MTNEVKRPTSLRCRLSTVSAAVLFMLTLCGGAAISYTYGASARLNIGYLDFSYEVSTGSPVDDPTGEKPESKLWWNDGFWWGSLYNKDSDAYHIYRLNWGTQSWEDTGVVLDDRRDTKADALWDQAHNKLYVASHVKLENSSRVNSPTNWARLFRYSYDAHTQSYALDSGFPVTVNEDKTEALVLEKDIAGRLWVAYVSRDPSVAPTDYQVYVNVTDGSDTNWGTPFSLGDIFPQAHVGVDDITTVVAFRDNDGDKIGVMWSNQLRDTFHFATHPDSTPDPVSGWDVVTITPPTSANDHISAKSLKTDSSGYVFAAVKTSTQTNDEALIGLIARDGDGNFTYHEYSDKVDKDTRPILLIDEDDNKLYVFVSDRPGGGMICYKATAINPTLSDLSFPPGDCGQPFIEDDTYDMIDNATSTKQNVNHSTGIVVMASDSGNGRVYVHNALGDPPPVVTNRLPAAGATIVPIDTTVMAAFSKAMNAATVNSSSFEVRDGRDPVAGTVAYDGDTRTATFTPHEPLRAQTVYTVSLNADVKDTSDQSLYHGFEMWSFATGPLKGMIHLPIIMRNH